LFPGVHLYGIVTKSILQTVLRPEFLPALPQLIRSKVIKSTRNSIQWCICSLLNCITTLG